MSAISTAHMRIARPSRDLESARRFWVAGLGLDVLYAHEADGGERQHSLLMVGWPDAGWHLELTRDPAAPLEPTPTPDDLLVVYLAGPVPDALVERLLAHGGTRVPAHNPYWDTWGVTVQDPDGYRLVLCTRSWSHS
ncbi:glyoxalase/bleomycin resistance protein/dioxygenase [Streptomyces laurentii]|uniref:Glyoxalase/bleomycin resistance protein/dioxygenase n=1 Tax=Streptomyces laurentii TaxID=39478 RepID=A0A160P0M0_STRLU|nr:glyoxalase/bleomycin resistance protein/dioxygenase [Streptomyces laurentii]